MVEKEQLEVNSASIFNKIYSIFLVGFILNLAMIIFSLSFNHARSLASYNSSNQETEIPAPSLGNPSGK
ncbi:MAG: hypothetical protein JKX95_08120 [Bacteroidia bacterium]|nr:hypothetical protein [Bacteroidia bacterium]